MSGVGPRTSRLRPLGQADAVIVGAGPNGLAAALTLARQGFRVTVLEAAEEPGGGTRSYADPAVPGLVHDHCSAVYPLGISSPYLRTLPLDRYGLEWVQPEIACAHPLDGGGAALLHQDIDETVAGLGHDGAMWRRLFAAPSRDFDALAASLLGPLVRVPRAPLTLVRNGLLSLAPASSVAPRFALGRDGPGAALFGGAAAHAVAPLSAPGTTGVALMLIAAGHRRGWPVARGGSASIWQAMVAMLEELGGEVVTGVRVRTLSELPPSRVRLFDVDPGQLANIVGSELDAVEARRFRRWRHATAAAFKIDLAVRGGVPWANADARRAGTLHLGGTFDEIAEARRRRRRARCPHGRMCSCRSRRSQTQRGGLAMSNRSGPTRTCRRVHARRIQMWRATRCWHNSSGLLLDCASASSRCTSPPQRTSRPVTRTWSAGTSRGVRSPCASS